ncbi:UNVERIFIED_CONTAM: Transcription repressor OFP14 [Sesamum radiatum]|uniref:Transcription repressor n=1 Tax=Sesamum radiatum TaxID=300843 RepID=A0AAW2PFP2_SESRA
MPKQIQKSFQECLSKIKISKKQIQVPLRSCKHPKTPSFSSRGGKKETDAATLSDVDQFLFENFRSLYQKEYEEETSKKTEPKTGAFLLESPRLLDLPLPQNLCRSARFFVASGSTSSLIMDEACSSSASPTNDSSVESEEAPEIAANDSSAPDDFIALLTYSPSPYEDFRRSMQEMVEARVEHNGKVDWKFLEELLFCYLDLNNKKSYRFILRAFVDVIVGLRENSGRIPASRRPWNGGAGRRRLNLN